MEKGEGDEYEACRQDKLHLKEESLISGKVLEVLLFLIYDVLAKSNIRRAVGVASEGQPEFLDFFKAIKISKSPKNVKATT